MNIANKIWKLFKYLLFLLILVLICDLTINFLLPSNVKKKIGTTKNYSIKSKRFHHDIVSNINVPEFWGDKKYQVITNNHGMRVGANYNYNVDKKNIGFMGDSFVYGSGLDYKDHFITQIYNKNDNYNLLNLGYVSYSPSIYFKKLDYFISEKKIKFKKIFLFVDTSDIQDEGIFYREDKKGNIVRKWNSDEKNEQKNFKYLIKNYLKQNSFIFKFYEIFFSATISEGPAKCLENKNNVTNFVKYLDYERFGYAYDAKIQSMDWVIEGQNKTLSYLDKIYNLLNENNINLEIVYYPSAIDILYNNKDTEKSNHFNLLKDWSSMREIPLIDTSKDFFKYSSSIQNYRQNHILCDMHWNSNGNKIIAKNILNKI